MRGASLRIKINAAIFVAFLGAAAAFAAILTYYMADREAAAQNRTRVLLAALAVHRLEALAPLLHQSAELEAARDILGRLVRVEGVVEASLFDGRGTLMSTAGLFPPPPLRADPGEALPDGRVYTVQGEAGKLSAILVEPIRGQGETLGFLRLRYAMRDLSALNRHVWLVFAVAVTGAYLFLATLLNILLHRFVLKPVDVLRQGLEAVEAGRLGHAVPVSSPDALGRMARAFNAMSARLRDTSESLAASRAEIEENRRLLAERVEERTAALARANGRLTAEVEARREAEARQARALALYKAILESTAEGVMCVGVGPQRDVLAVNRRFLELWGLPDDWPSLDHNARGRAIGDRLREPEAAEQAFRDLMRDDTHLYTACLELRDGRFLERRSGPIIQGAAYIGRVLSYVDVTADKEREASTERAKNRAEDASKAKGAFLAVMSHEIRTPLNVVIGLTEEMLARPASEEQLGHLRTVRESAAHLLGVVNDILDFSKIEAGKLVLERLDFDVRRLVAGVAEAFDREVRRKGLGFEVRVADGLPGTLCGDPGRLRQVLLNLVGNAVKFTEAGAVSLSVGPAPPAPGTVPDGRIGIEVRVADTGIGIEPDRLPRIFEHFEQGGGSIGRRFGGTGLGLAISKGIVERMGGRITVESRTGEGSVFRFTVRLLPSRNTGPEAGEESTEALDGVPGGSGGRAGLRILLVEDNALNAAVTRLHMARMGHALTVAVSAREAYGLLAREPFDVVLMDVEMPDIDGIAATRTIRAGGPPGEAALDPGLPIVAVTAHAVEDVRQQCLEAGMTGFVTKPVNFRTLQRVLESAGRGVASALPASPAEGGAAPMAGAAGDGGPALFDPGAAREAMGISWNQYAGVSRVSFDEALRRLDQAGAALVSGNLEEAAIAAHTVKGAAATLGAYSSRDLAGTLEKALRRGDADAARQAQAALAALWRRVGEAFADWRPPADE
uniref:histidine kinase n=1 Tax=Desulfovibrio sp. U5L TaxID=596152 RepID=I2PWT9_9BACT